MCLGKGRGRGMGLIGGEEGMVLSSPLQTFRGLLSLGTLLAAAKQCRTQKKLRDTS